MLIDSNTSLRVKKIEHYDKTKQSTFYSISKAEAIINKSDIDDLFESICTTIISNMIQKIFRKRFRMDY